MMEPLVLFSVLLIAVPAFARFGPINIAEDSFAPPPNGPLPPPPPPPQPMPGPYNRLHFARFFRPRNSLFRGPITDYGNFRLHHHHQVAGLHKVLLHNEVLATHHVVNGLRKDVLVRLMIFAVPSAHDDKLHPLILQTKLNGFSEISIPTTLNNNNNDHTSPPFVPMTTTTTTSTPIPFDSHTRENPVSEEPAGPSEINRNKRSIDNPMGNAGQDFKASFEKMKNKITQSYNEVAELFKSTIDNLKKNLGGGGMPSMPASVPGMDAMSGMASGGMPSMPMPGADSMGKMPEMPGMGRK